MSGLRCRPGDLAAITAGEPEENLGKVIRVTALSECSPFLAWFYEGEVLGPFGGRAVFVADDCLRPLRPDEGTDETLRIAGRPQESVRDALVSIREML